MELITQIITSLPGVFTGWVIPILFVMTLVVFFHELGHFLVARWCNVTIDAFSIGFGKEIFGFTDKNNTRWKFCWIPLGGYVKFADDADAASAQDKEAFEKLTDEQKAGAFHNKPLWQKALVVAAGPIASFLLGWIIFTGIHYANGQTGPSGLIDIVVKDSAAEKAGLKKGDQITHINGSETKFFNDIYRIVSFNGEEKLELTVLRDNQSMIVPITPELKMVDNGMGRKISMGRIGIGPSRDKTTWVSEKYTPFGAAVAAKDQTQFIITSTLGYISKLLTGRESIDKLNGPIGIGKIVNHFSGFGLVSTLYIAGLLSVSIGLFNLFPIPMLDGGHLLFYAIEAIRGKPASEKVMEYSFRAGLALLLGMMILASFNDI